MQTSGKKRATNIALLTENRKRIMGLGQVRSMDMYDADKNFHPEGLYSSEIFGRVGSKTRMSRHGWIDLRTEILHPKVYLELKQLKELYIEILSGKGYAVWNTKTNDFDRSDILTGETGFAFFMKHLRELTPPKSKSADRNEIIKMIKRFQTDGLAINFLPVAPAGLRDLDTDESGRPVENEFNPKYRKVLAATNVIDKSLYMKNDPILDTARYTLQLKVNDIWNDIMQLLHGNGKNGIWRSKFASRRVAYATANVISAMDPAGLAINSPRSYDLTRTMYGIMQTAKGTEPLLCLWQMPNGIAKSIIENGGIDVDLVDRKTGKPVRATLSEKQIGKWCTEAGRVKLLNGFKQLHLRHEPIIIDGHYMALVHKDKHGARVVYNKEDVPKEIREAEGSTLTPLTWGEYFYIETAAYVDRVRAFVTRYPVADDGSNYPTRPYLRSTVAAKIYKQYNESWELTDNVWAEFPNTQERKAWFNTTAVSQYYIAGLGADYDGDRTQSIFVWANESIAEIDARLSSIEHYLGTDGNMKNSYTVETFERVLRSFTGYDKAKR